MFEIHNRFQCFIDHEFVNNDIDDEQVNQHEFNENLNKFHRKETLKKSKNENERLRNYWEIPDFVQSSSINSSNLPENKKKTIVDNQSSSLITTTKSSLVVSNHLTIDSSKKQISNCFPPQPYKFNVRRSIATHQQYRSTRNYPKLPKNFVQSQSIRGNTKSSSHQI